MSRAPLTGQELCLQCLEFSIYKPIRECHDPDCIREQRGSYDREEEPDET